MPYSIGLKGIRRLASPALFMWIMETIIYLVVIIFCSSLVNSTFGFGFALVCMPLLSLRFGLDILGPLIPLLFVVGSSIIVIKERKDIQFKSILPIVLSAAIIIPVGVHLGKHGNELFIKTLLGLFIISFSIYSLTGFALPKLRNERWALIIGSVSGIFGGAYNITGPPIVIYGTLREWSPQAFRVTLQCCFLLLTFTIIGSHIWAGSYHNHQIFEYFLYAFPSMTIAVPLGKKINQAIKNPAHFNKYVYSLMLFSGIVLIAKAIGYI